MNDPNEYNDPNYRPTFPSPPIAVPMVPVPTHVGIDWGKGDRTALTAVVPTTVIPPGKVLVYREFVAKVRKLCEYEFRGGLANIKELMLEIDALLPAE